MDLHEIMRLSESRNGSDLRIVEAYQSSSLRSQSYTRQVQKRNKGQLNELLNGMNNTLNDIVYLQVSGRSQLDKEIEEISRSKGTMHIDEKALHRNEVTKEVEEEGVGLGVGVGA